MQVTITQKCDRSGREESILVDSADVAVYEGRNQRRQEALAKIEEFIATIPADDLPDLFAVYRGELQAFINVNATFCDKPVSRLLGQLFHASDPKTRAKRGSKKKQNGDVTQDVTCFDTPTTDTEELARIG
ncbi:MAG: hypothetical protein PVI90_00885 [Desulfobacteraceae bacterium]|jgi:hypothetical protein